MKRHLMVICALALIGLASCSTVTMTEKGANVRSGSPSWESSKSYFLAGLVGEHHINVKDVCEEKAVKQIVIQNTFVDSLLGGITFGIYTPRTAKIWCE